MLTRRKVKRDYEFYKRKAFEYWQQGDVRKALIAVHACGELAYGYFCVDSFGDDELDELLYQIGKAKLTIPSIENPQDKRVVFFDSFASDNRGITEQYLDALHYNGYEILFVTSNSQFRSESKLGKLLSGYENCRVVVLPAQTPLSQLANQAAQEIADWHVSKAFIHIGPYDVMPIMLFSQYAGVLHRYFINLTDHAWWLGKNCIDTNLEFRQFGFALSTQVRGIDKSKEALIPYYPVSQLSNETIDDLLPEGLDGKFVIVTGGTFYKYLDADFTLLKLMLRVFRENPNVVLLMVGTSKAGIQYKKRAERAGFGDRIYLMDNTPYLLSVFEHAQLYLCSYPMTGGLMAQIAAKQGLPVVAYSAKGMDYNDLTDICYSNQFVIHSSKSAFCEQIHQLACDKEYYRQYADSFCYDEQKEIGAFRDKLRSILKKDEKNNEIVYPSLNLLAHRMSDTYLHVENAFYHVYRSTIVHYNTHLEISIKESIRKKMKQWFIRKIAGLQKMAEKYCHEQNWKMVSGRFLSLGANANIVHPYYIYGQWNIEVGKNFSAGPNFWMEAIDRYGEQHFSPKITIGDNVRFQRNCHIGAIKSITIGNDVLTGSNILITDHSHGETSKKLLEMHPSLRPLSSKGPVVIGDRVWIGENAIILPGVTLGEGCIVGAGAVVTNSFPENSVVGGNPARLLKRVEQPS